MTESWRTLLIEHILRLIGNQGQWKEKADCPDTPIWNALSGHEENYRALEVPGSDFGHVLFLALIDIMQAQSYSAKSALHDGTHVLLHRDDVDWITRYLEPHLTRLAMEREHATTPMSLS